MPPRRTKEIAIHSEEITNLLTTQCIRHKDSEKQLKIQCNKIQELKATHTTITIQPTYYVHYL